LPTTRRRFASTRTDISPKNADARISTRGDYDWAISGSRRQRQYFRFYDCEFAYLAKGDKERTLADANEAIRLDPANINTYFNCAVVNI
jgi:hypothetical protein